MTDDELLAAYSCRFESKLDPLARRLEEFVKERLGDVERVDRVSARAKDPLRFLAKATKVENGARKYEDPFSQIQDQIAARINVFYLPDVAIAEATVAKYFTGIERKNHVPESANEFGYEGTHLVLALPEELIDDPDDRDIPEFFELQIKTLFQHAWSEAEHDLAYKPAVELTRQHRRSFAFTAAQAWGADDIFAKLFAELSGK